MLSNAPCGEQLKQFRKQRGMSQLDLATRARSTPRYVSFVETGRSRPGREVVLRISEALGLSLRDSNALLLAAGLAPEYSESPLDEAALKPARNIINQVLENHNPYPAWAIASGFRFVAANRAAEKLFPGMIQLDPMTLVDMWCGPNSPHSETMRQKSIGQILTVLRHELLHYPHPDLPALLSRVESYSNGLKIQLESPDSPILCGEMPVGEQVARTIATIMRFDKAIDITIAELRVELVFPADEESAAILQDYFNS